MALHSSQNPGNSGWLDSFVFFVLVFLIKQNCYSELITRMDSGLHTVNGAHA